MDERHRQTTRSERKISASICIVKSRSRVEILRTMRSVGRLLLLALALALLHRWSAGAELVARATLALGVLAVIAELAGRLMVFWGWPRVTGFLASGILLGPYGLGLVRAEEAAALRVIGDAAVALFALRAGLELRGNGTDGRAGPPRYLTASVVVPFVVTAGVVYALHPWFPLTIHQPTGDAVAVALALGAVTVVAAPGLTWLAKQDTPDATTGRDLLRLHVMRDFVAVPLFAVTLLLVRFLTSAGTLHEAAFWLPLLALAVSVVGGGLMAGLVIRFAAALAVPSGVVMVAVAIGAGAAGLLGQGEVTITALVAGLVLARWGGDGAGADRLRRHFDVRGVTLAGAAFAIVAVGLDVSAWFELWPWMALLVFVRGAGLYWAGRWAARDAAVTDVLARQGWLGLISQAGVGLLLASVGRRAFPEWGVSFESLVVGLVAVHATFGPLCMRWALARRASPVEGASGAA